MIKSQSLHFFRAFQVNSKLQILAEQGRNPFTFSGHFKLKTSLHSTYLPAVAIPSLFQGISRKPCLSPLKPHVVAIPSLFQGISSGSLQAGVKPTAVAIPSLFQGISRGRTLLFSIYTQNRNPFTFSGHFKEELISTLKQIICESQSLHFFRAFQVKNE